MSKGTVRHIMKCEVMPPAQMSAPSDQRRPRSCSGARYSSPLAAPSSLAKAAAAAAVQKLASLIPVAPRSRRMFAGWRLPWLTPSAWMWHSPCTTCKNSGLAPASPNGPRCSTCACTVSALSQSRMSHESWRVSKKALAATTASWRNLRSTRNSLMSWSRSEAATFPEELTHLTTTSRPSALCTARRMSMHVSLTGGGLGRNPARMADADTNVTGAGSDSPMNSMTLYPKALMAVMPQSP
mmetsp:Transcript_99828/g.305138  ORF Transcript_99828/g.305138 Transcript_99828/m.305138 type:complete len:240 (+) Transcript_99828:44-763(+)